MIMAVVLEFQLQHVQIVLRTLLLHVLPERLQQTLEIYTQRPLLVVIEERDVIQDIIVIQEIVTVNSVLYPVALQHMQLQIKEQVLRFSHVGMGQQQRQIEQQNAI